MNRPTKAQLSDAILAYGAASESVMIEPKRVGAAKALNDAQQHVIELVEALYASAIPASAPSGEISEDPRDDLIARLRKQVDDANGRLSDFESRNGPGVAPQPVAAAQAVLEGFRPTDDELWDATLRDRDAYHDMADQLAAQIAAMTEVEIGEHSNMNDPWRNALIAGDEFIAEKFKEFVSAHSLASPSPAAQKDAQGAVPRTPTEAMLIAARDWSVKKMGRGVGNGPATECWQAMYDAAQPTDTTKGA